MKTARQLLLVAAVSILLSACSRTQSPESQSATAQPAPDTSTNSGADTLALSGTVSDTSDKPIAGAAVECWRYEGNFFQTGAMEMRKQTTTAADGSFELHVPHGMEVLLARKPGFAPAWKQLGQPFSPSSETENKLVLTPPGLLAGVVVDESNQPLANAEVFVLSAFNESSAENGGRSFNFFTGKLARDCFSTHTDSAGHFRIENFPTNASARFGVKFSGKVLRSSPEDFNGPEPSGYRAGQKDIELVMEPAGNVEGKIIGATSDTPLASGRVILQSDQGDNFIAFRTERVPADSNGVFRFDDLRPGSYQVRAVIGTNVFSDWISEPVPVSIEAGRTTRGVQLKAIRGGVLEVTVQGKDDHKPLPKLNVSVFKRGFGTGGISDSNGVARLRLLPGEYQVVAVRNSMPSDQAEATVIAGQTNRVEIEVASPTKITGIVRGLDGKPAAGLPVQLIGGYGPSSSRIKTDAHGRFELEWNPRQIRGQSESTACILVRDVEHNLAAAQDIDENTTNLDLKLAAGLTLVGHAQAAGKPITNATAQLVFWTGRSGAWVQGLALTNTPGQYEIPALPPGRRYGIVVSAPGYGQQQLYNLEISAEPGRQELDTVELNPANLRLSGQVLDTSDKPVAGCFVNLSGNRQPNANARTDRTGRFVFQHVCAGPVRLFANSRGSFGSISAEGGDTNVVLQLGQNYASNPDATLHKLKGIVTDADGKPVEGAEVAVFPNNGSRWFKTEANGAYNLTWSLQQWQSGDTLLVVRDTARNLGATADLSQDTTNLDVKLSPALTLTGLVRSADNSPLHGAEVGLWLKTGNSYNQFDERMTPVNADGRYEIKCLPMEAEYIIFAKAKDYGRSQRQLEPDTGTNRMDLEPFVLKPADRVIAGRVLKDDDKPASGVNVQLNGEDQPEGYMTTDTKGRFHFKVCEGQVRLFAYSQYGGGSAQATVEAGDTNIVMNLSSSQGGFRESSHRASLKGKPLPVLASVNLAADVAPAGQPVLLCLFNASERPSRHVIHLLDQQAVALQGKNIRVLGVQSAVISDEIFNEWKTAAPVSFPVGRVTAKSTNTRWASDVPALPWLILADSNHRVVAEGFSFNNLDAQIQKMLKAKE